MSAVSPQAITTHEQIHTNGYTAAQIHREREEKLGENPVSPPCPEQN